MRFSTVIGLLALVFVGAAPSTAHADWREGILGNRIYPNPLAGASTPQVTAPKPKPATSASPGASSKPSKSQSTSSGTKSSPKKKPATVAKSKPALKSKSATAEAPTPKSKSSTSTVSSGQVLTGKASYYWQPQKLASGGYFNPSAMTAAHKSLPFGTKVRVTNERNGKSVVVTINDRGPYIAGRIIDLSAGAAGVIAMKEAGVVPVKVTILGK
jgi:rare lipoprotein A